MTGEEADARPPPRRFGDRLKQCRELRGWSPRELARQSGVDHRWILRLEDGTHHNVSLDRALKLAEALGVTVDYLAKGNGQSQRLSADLMTVAATMRSAGERAL